VDLGAGNRLAIAPAVQHFQGEVKIDEQAATSVPGLFAAGECAGGQHGANRPGGNALCDCQVFGKIAGESALRWAQRGVRRRSNLDVGRTASQNGRGLAASEVLVRVKTLMDRYGGVVRTPDGLADGLDELERIARRGVTEDDAGPITAVEARSALIVARMVLAAAGRRRESRGPHLVFENPGDARPLPRDDAEWRRYIVIRNETNRMILDVRSPGIAE